MPTQEQKVALSRLKAATSGSRYLSITSDVATPPDCVSGLLGSFTGDQLRDQLERLSDKISDDALNNESTLAKDKGYYKLSNWASGGRAFRRFKEETVTDYFEELFEMVVAVSMSHQSGSPPWFDGEHIRLSRADLFHGHLIFDNSTPSAQDVLLLFHAKEYPSDIEPNKSQFAKTLEPGNYEEFKTSSADFKYRCSIFSLRHNKLWMLRLSDNGSPYRDLIANRQLTAPQNPLRLEQDFLGDCVADINFFPNDNSRLFFCVMPRSS
ncbi:hypothetical protein [Cystobacter ferrugineus]|uniref:Uncharacterized protein n=1 Tax=Cystobacter ferrugineus TaxID=83449 RepID=A0A1L9BDE2_9BACT|nr:hypothetical protein [Cystobacter ferrugineus]OJH40265.1 hypothetical protein BON30_14575 [Cystobacter ferrugineus]